MEHPFAEGNLRYVARGIYTSGKRRNQECVIKWFKTGHVESNTFFKYDIRAVDKALEIISEFNNAEVLDQHIRLNIPDVWVFGDDSGYLAGKKVLVEPYIEDFEKCMYILVEQLSRTIPIADASYFSVIYREFQHRMEQKLCSMGPSHGGKLMYAYWHFVPMPSNFLTLLKCIVCVVLNRPCLILATTSPMANICCAIFKEASILKVLLSRIP